MKMVEVVSFPRKAIKASDGLIVEVVILPP